MKQLQRARPGFREQFVQFAIVVFGSLAARDLVVRGLQFFADGGKIHLRGERHFAAFG